MKATRRGPGYPRALCVGKSSVSRSNSGDLHAGIGDTPDKGIMSLGDSRDEAEWSNVNGTMAACVGCVPGRRHTQH